MTHLLLIDNEWEAFEESIYSFLYLITQGSSWYHINTIYAVESLTSCTTGMKITSIKVQKIYI